MKISLATPEQAEQLVEWTAPHRERTGMLLGATVLCAANGNGPVTYMVTRPAIVIECLGPNPEAGHMELSKALYRLMETVKGRGVQVITFTGPDDVALARLAEHYGFERLSWQGWRME